VQVKGIDIDPFVIYREKGCSKWHLGQSVKHVLASARQAMTLPPKGSGVWTVQSFPDDDESMDGSPMVVRHVTCPRHKELKALMRLMEIDEMDVETMFSLCGTAEVDMAKFLSLWVESRLPARRLEMMQLARKLRT